jgi:adenosylcobinamide-GDP ribazoletransferase
MQPSSRSGPYQTPPVNDNGPEASTPSGRTPPPIANLLDALRFFSRLPVRGTDHRAPSLDGIARVLPLASLVIGVGPALILILGVFLHLPPLFAGAGAVLAMVLVTGAMAEDGLADAADGLFGGVSPASRLDIFRDSRHGTYGVLALVLAVVMKAAALGSMAEFNALAAAATWLAASLFARSAGLWLTVALPPARAGGASASAGRVRPASFATGMVLALLLVLVLALPAVGPVLLALALICGGLVTMGWTRLCRRLVGGQTGDLIGALQALIEITMLGCLSIAFF